jgi:hypothetical protein
MFNPIKSSYTSSMDQWLTSFQPLTQSNALAFLDREIETQRKE